MPNLIHVVWGCGGLLCSAVLPGVRLPSPSRKTSTAKGTPKTVITKEERQNHHLRNHRQKLPSSEFAIACKQHRQSPKSNIKNVFDLTLPLNCQLFHPDSRQQAVSPPEYHLRRGQVVTSIVIGLAPGDRHDHRHSRLVA